jgi:hypothetical protein
LAGFTVDGLGTNANDRLLGPGTVVVVVVDELVVVVEEDVDEVVLRELVVLELPTDVVVLEVDVVFSVVSGIVDVEPPSPVAWRGALRGSVPGAQSVSLEATGARLRLVVENCPEKLRVDVHPFDATVAVTGPVNVAETLLLIAWSSVPAIVPDTLPAPGMVAVKPPETWLRTAQADRSSGGAVPAKW